MRFFNTAGPVNSNDHYCLPPLHRFKLDEIIALIEQKKYFVLHAPRQTGKTTCLFALAKYLNETGKYEALYINVEQAQAAREDVENGIKAILSELANNAIDYLNDDFPKKNWKKDLEEAGGFGALNALISSWSKNNKKQIILLIDEIDSLIGDTLISVLRQIRAGYAKRPKLFPQSIILCGVRDVRDYRIHSSASKEIITGGSAFNIKAKSLRLGNFNRKEVELLYKQHTKETGQLFESDAIDYAFELTEGQPWLVNALAYEVCFEMEEGKNRNTPITIKMLEQAKENIIVRRETHLDQLIDKLQEDRVRNVIEPILAGKEFEGSFKLDDVQYTIDLGLIKQAKNGELLIANKIYKEIIPRELAWTIQTGISQNTSWYLNNDGSLNMNKLLKAFQEFFRRHSDSWLEKFQYKEAGPQILLQAFLQRIINGGGRVDREYGLGRKRTDILITWPYNNIEQKIVIELKILYANLEETISKGIKQTSEYLDICGTDQGNLIIFNKNSNKTWDEKIFYRQEVLHGKTINVWGM